MSQQTRIFLESRVAFNPAFCSGHLYMVKRVVELDDTTGQITNSLKDTDDVIQATSSTVLATLNRLTVSAGIRLDASPDRYVGNDTPASRFSLDITSFILAGGVSGTVDAAWTVMANYARGIGEVHYNYEFPDGIDNHLANSNATILSALNTVGVDVRALPRHDGNPGSYLDGGAYFANNFPGASNSSDSTLLGSGSQQLIVTSKNLENGVVLLGRDNVADEMVGTRFADRFYGEQKASYTATFDTVNYGLLTKDWGFEKGLTANFSQSALPSPVTKPVYVTGVNFSANGTVVPGQADELFGIERVLLTEKNDTVQAGNFKVFQNRLTIDAGAQAGGTGDRIDFAGYQVTTTKAITEVFNSLGAGKEKISITVNGLSIQKDEVQFANVRLQNFEILNATAKNDHISGARQFKIITTGDGDDFVGNVSGSVLPQDAGQPAELREWVNINLGRGADILGANISKGSTVDVGAGDGAIDRINYSAGIRVTGVGHEDFLYVNNRRMTGAVAVKNDKGRAFDEEKGVIFAVNGDGNLRMAA
jgi:hypothetical protein